MSGKNIVFDAEKIYSFRKNSYLICSNAEFDKLIEQRQLSFPDRHRTHFLKVLRHKNDDTIWVGNGFGKIIETRLQGNLLVSCGQAWEFVREVSQTVSLFQAIVKLKNLEWLIQKTTELGVAEIHLFSSQFSQPCNLNLNRLEEIILNSAQQSKSRWLPRLILEDKKFENLRFPSDRQGYWGDPTFMEQKENQYAALPKFFINGPEGGWSISEQEFLKKGFLSINLCENVLRSETAAISAVTVLLNGELKNKEKGNVN